MQEEVVKEGGIRVDAYVASITDISRTKIANMIKNEEILVNNKKVKASYILEENDVIQIGEYEPEIMDAKPEKMDLDIVYEDDDVIVINKANGVVVHPAPGNTSGTLVNGLLYHFKNLSKVNGNLRPGIVHRIDAYTTGLLMVAKNDYAHNKLASELSEQKTNRKYIALVHGVINNDTGIIDAPIGRDPKNRKKMTVTDVNSKEAVTEFKVLERFKNATLLEVTLKTGRTHQIRVHMNYINHPVVNDPVYGNRKLIDETGQCLHAKTIGFNHPRTGKYMEFTSELPECFVNIMKKFQE